MNRVQRLMQAAAIAILTWVVSASPLLVSSAMAAKAYGPPICPHILGWPDDVKEWANGAPWIKALDVTSCAIAKERGARVFYRVWDHDSGPDGNTDIGGEKFGQEILDRLKHIPQDKWPDAISYQNEFASVDEKKAECFMVMYDKLREGGYEGMIIFGSYGPGGPPDMKEWAKPYVKAAVLKSDGVETHEYWDLTIKHYDTWLAHRHVRMMNEYPYLKTKPWFIGEFGSDGVTQHQDPQKRSGWRDRGKMTADEYIEQIEIYRYGDPKDEVVAPAENVMAVFLYQQGAPPHMWQGWETRGTKVMGYMQSTWKPTHAYLNGTVTDAKGQPVADAKIESKPSGKKAVTDAKGRFWLFALEPGEHTIQVSKDGIKAKPVKQKVKPGDIAEVKINVSAD